MSIKTEFFKTREDGVNLYKKYSSLKYKLQSADTKEYYDYAIDVEGADRVYIETNIPVPPIVEEKTDNFVWEDPIIEE